jgi:DNA-binding CsgD family transcriptional regulator
MSLNLFYLRFFGTLICCFLAVSLPAQYLFEGMAPTAYHGEEVYLDILDEWDDFHMISDQMPVRRAPVDSNGFFQMEGTGLPAGKGFYRLRFALRGTPPISMDFGQRHFIHFLAQGNDTLRFEGLSVADPGLVHAIINKRALQLDELAKEETHAESERLLTLIDERRRVLLSNALPNTPTEVALFLLGSWPGDGPPVGELTALEAKLEKSPLRPGYLISLRERIGAVSVGPLRARKKLLSWLLGASILGNLIFLFFWWRGRRSKGSSFEEQSNKALSIALLTAKEQEVLQLISTGRSNKEIAGELFISMATVKSHINSIYKKTGAGNRKAIIDLGQ